MIDLSHLTEEEQGMIMTVLRRDLELKKCEGERVRKLEKVLHSGSSDTKLKYLSGEWFYEAKSRRHTDKIHGSDIILASMKQRKAAGLDGSRRIERSKTPSSRASDIIPPPKPARCLEVLQPQQMNDAEKENLNSGVRSPRTLRHNPFNRASLIVVEPPENNNDMSPSRDQESPKTELISPLKNHPAGEPCQTSGGSVTSEGSSAGFRPVPKKRTFLSRRPCIEPESNDQGLDSQVQPEGIVPSPRRSLQQGSSGSSNQSHPQSRHETPQKSAVAVCNQVSEPTHASSSADETSQQPLCAVSQVSSISSLERERKPPSTTRDGPAYTRGDVFAETETPEKRGDDQTQTEHVGMNTVVLPTNMFQDSARENSSSVVIATGQEELSFTRRTVDPAPPVSYDLNFIDMPDQQTQHKSNQKHVFKLSTQATSPTGDEEDSIAKVLDWFSRSQDSSDWLKTKDSSEATKGSDKHAEMNKLRREDSLRNDTGDRKETLDMKRSHLQRQTNEVKEFRATDTIGNKEQTETEEEVMKDIGERMRSQEVKDDDDEWQSPKISHLKSFWEKSNTGPKILISKSITPSNNEKKPVQLPAEKDEENENKRTGVSDKPSGIYNGKGINDKYTSNHVDEKEQQLLISPQTDGGGDSVHLNIEPEVINPSTQRNNHDPTHNSDFLKLLSSHQEDGRTGSDTEVLCVTRLGPQPRTAIHSRVSPDPESFSSVKPNQQPHSMSQFQETAQQQELPETKTVPPLDIDLQTRPSPGSQKICLSRNSSNVDYNPDENDVQTPPKAKMCRSSSEDVKSRDSEDKGPHSSRQGLQQESTAERIKQLKSFWEQEMNKPIFYTGKSKTLGDGKVACGANQARLNKRFTKSEYDLRSVGNDSDSDAEDSNRNYNNFTVLPLNQRIENLSPSLSMSRSHFNTLREFWDEATSDTKASPSFDKPKTPKRKEPISSQIPSQELQCGDPDGHCISSTVEKSRPAALKSSPPPQNRPKSPHDRQTGSGSRAASDSKNIQSVYTTAESKRSSKDSNREEKTKKAQIASGKETRSPKGRKDSFGNSSGRNSLRRATSMFTLSVPDPNDQCELKMDVGPVQSQSRKERQNTDKVTMLRRSSEETETLTPRARAFVPRDYRHYLGMTDQTSVHASPAPAVKEEGYEFDLSSPVRASTPVSSEERYSRKSNKMIQRPLWANYSSSDTGQESSVSSTSETWSMSRNSSNRENDNESLVRKALRRAEARPKTLAKSMEDITASLSPRQERKQEPAADMRRISDVSTIPSPSSSLFSDPDHLKKMSKSVPSFLQKEDADVDTDSTFEDHRGKLMMGRSMTNLTNSSGMTSVSSLSGSVMTMYSGDFGNIEVQGNIQFSINYIQRLREFHIFVAECRDLAAVDQKRGRSDPYVKSYLVPDKANLGKRKTSVKKKTLNPTFNEILRYRVRMEYLRVQTLILSVWHHDTFGRNSFLGEVDVDLSNWDFDHTQMNYLALKPRNIPSLDPSNDRGEMRLAIRFLPQITRSEGITKGSPNLGEIHIWVKECKNLPLIRTTIDPYVKCFVLPDTSRKSRQKTRVLRRTVDPVFNHTMVYDGIREVDLTEACVELTVWDRDRLASNLLGGLRLGSGTGRSYGAVVDWMDSASYEVALWERMMASPNEWVEDVLPLRMLSSAKTAFK